MSVKFVVNAQRILAIMRDLLLRAEISLTQLGKKRRKKERKKVATAKNETYNIRDSLVVTDPTTSLTLRSLCVGERTGPSIFCELWPYVPELNAGLTYKGKAKAGDQSDVSRFPPLTGVADQLEVGMQVARAQILHGLRNCLNFSSQFSTQLHGHLAELVTWSRIYKRASGL